MNSFLRPFLLLAFCFSPLAFSADVPETKLKYGTWGFDLAGMDSKTKPGDDFFRYANGAWIDKTQIPADKPAYSLRLAMTDLTERRLKDLLEAAGAKQTDNPSTLEEKAGAFYRSFMDEGRVGQLGPKVIEAELNDLKNAKTRDDFAALMGRTTTDFEFSLFNPVIDIDLKDPKKYAFYLGQAGLGLPDRDYYLKPDFTGQKTAYQNYVTTILKLLNWPDAEKSAKDIVDFESKIADVSWTKTQQRDLNAIYNPMSIEELKKFAPGFAWENFLTETKMARLTRVIVAEKSAFPKIVDVYSKAPIETIRAWQAFHIADNAAPYLSKPFTDAYFELHDKTLSGQKEEKVRWKRAITTVGGGDFGVGDRFGTFGTLGFGVGQLYTAKYFPPEAKAKIQSLVDNLKSAYRARIEKLDWMGPETKKEALKKLDTYTIKVGYPDHPRDYSKLVIKGDDLTGNVKRCAQLDWDFYTGRFFGAVDRADWGMTPQTNDAYNGSLRDIVFPAGILQPPIFDADADPAINYGAAGGVIGHELTHGFDDQGRKIDASGALRDWWTEQDAETFKKRADMLGAQYSKYEPIPNLHVNGELTMGENIADLGGLTLALDAYRASLKGQEAPVLDGYSGDQRVLLGWAQAWRGKVTDDYVRKQVVSDPHSPRQFRVIGPTRNTDAWYDAFKVQSADKMFVEPDQRVRIW
ncbi:MAG TPA: M13-type metalloendopeptidase [Chthoniobacterales bacterium]|jgi:putative endopeptidase|nr:M13-type metalloendopeptidase [Chthoniobacterales bacterium]